MLGVDEKWVHPLSMNSTTVLPDTGGVEVTLIEANHCMAPLSVLRSSHSHARQVQAHAFSFSPASKQLTQATRPSIPLLSGLSASSGISTAAIFARVQSMSYTPL